MDKPDSLTLHRALGDLMREIERDSAVRAELDRARREFFGVAVVDVDPLQQAAADERFAEWFLLERESDVIGEVPVRRLARERGHREACELLQTSTVSVFQVERSGEVARLHDLQDQQVVAMERPEMLDLAAGDLVVGRLYVDPDGAHVPSAAVAVQRGGEPVARAFRRDLDGLGLDRRLTQLELEHLLFRRLQQIEAARRAAPPLERLEADLEQLLRGTSLAAAGEISRALAETDAPGAIIGPLLDDVAFHTAIDLEPLRKLLMEIWNAHHAGAAAAPAAESAPAGSAPAATGDAHGLGERLAERIAAGLQQGEDVEKLFDDVAEMLGEDLDEPEDDADAAGGFEGDLRPLIQEFLWEEKLEDSPEAAVLWLLHAQQHEAPVPKLELEYLDATDLLRLLLRVYFEAPPAERGRRTKAAFAALERFYRWAERTQEYKLAEVLRATSEIFLDDLDRLQRAGVALASEVGAAAGRPQLLRVTAVDPAGFEVVAAEGGDPVGVTGGAAAAPDLREGDLLLAVLSIDPDGDATIGGLAVALPAAAEALLG